MQGLNLIATKELIYYDFINCIYFSKDNEETLVLSKVMCKAIRDFKVNAKIQDIVFVKVYFTAL